MSFVIRLAGTMLALWAAVQLVPGLDFEGSAWALAGIALIFGVVNAFVRPILNLLSLPLILLTLGLFVLVVNAVTFLIVSWLAGPSMLDLGLEVDGFWPAFWGALVVAIISGLVNAVFTDD